ncbi:hypothetical protein ACLOJK_023955 [Asimina triloba]
MYIILYITEHLISPACASVSVHRRSTKFRCSFPKVAATGETHPHSPTAKMGSKLLAGDDPHSPSPDSSRLSPHSLDPTAIQPPVGGPPDLGSDLRPTPAPNRVHLQQVTIARSAWQLQSQRPTHPDRTTSGVSPSSWINGQHQSQHGSSSHEPQIGPIV